MRPADAPWPRHRLVRVTPAAWAALIASRADLAGEPLLERWARHGWPLIVRRRTPDEVDGAVLSSASWVPVGLPLPPSAGKQRIALQVPVAAIASTAALPDLRDVIASAPKAWQPTLHALLAIAGRHAVHTRVFGSLAWQWLTGLDYLGPNSDIDLVWTLPRADGVDAFLAALAGIDATAPMRIDGELLRADGAAVNWRELHTRSADVLLKTAREPRLCTRDEFMAACA